MFTRDPQEQRWMELITKTGKMDSDMNRDRSSIKIEDARSRWARAAGFTMLELMVVIAIIFILLGMAAPRFERAMIQAKEAALKQDLYVMRQAIDHFTLDKQSAPQSLEDLVSAGYLREIPVDPLTGLKDWRVETSEFVLSAEQNSTGISEVHSNSGKISPSQNTPYNTW
jgi:general secretion pathway protein G